ncbi:DUF6320 domain-containing protein [Brooklawnia sp.]|uniref:DUF6320 domain-containing protein n=1 Tax=Brooklawnia sp. TaxID=2699740 RepID=UPI00311D4811
MRHCPDCSVDIEGDWTTCPLCGAVLTGTAAPSPLPAIPLSFSRQRVLRVVFLISLVVILASFLAQLLFSHGPSGIGVLRSVWLGVTAMWLVVMMAFRKRRNIAKGTVYLVVLISLVCVYWDYLTGWQRWSLTYAVPIVCAFSIVALMIAVWAMHVEVSEHIVYSGLTMLLGLVPIGFLVLGWVTNALPSAVCVLVSLLALLFLRATRQADVRHELAKRLHV